MEVPMATRYWCHLCSQMVNPIMEVEIKCPLCQNGFVEEMSSDDSLRDIQDSVPDFGNDRRALSLWAPILMGMMSNPSRHRRNHRFESSQDDDHLGYNNQTENENGEGRNRREIDLVRELEEMLRRRRRGPAATVQLLQGLRAGLALELETNIAGTDRDRERERVILINPFNQTIMIQGSNDLNPRSIGSLGDYFIGPGLDTLIQHLAGNDPNRYGTPPAQKEAVESLPTVKISENSQCSICLDDFETGSEGKQMPCEHKFHNECLLPWLELHSSCPVCRYQLPTDETKAGSERYQNNNGTGSTSTAGDSGNDNNRDRSQQDGQDRTGRWFSIPWLFSSLFSSSRDDNNSS